MIMSGLHYQDLLKTVLDSALFGMESFTKNNQLKFPADYRLAFRELGLSIGLKSVKLLMGCIKENPDLFGWRVQQQVESLMNYEPLADTIERFWIDDKNRKFGSWIEHQEIKWSCWPPVLLLMDF